MTDSGPGNNTQRDLTRTFLAVLLMVILIGGSFWVLRPFLLAIIWAAMIVVATWPMMLKLQHAIRSRALAVTIMSGAMVLVFVVPLVLAIQAVVDNADTIKGWTETLATATIPPPPEWVSRIPLVGSRIAEAWAGIAAAGKSGLAARLAPYAASAAQWLAGALGGFGVLAVQFLLTVIIAVVIYTQGDAATAGVSQFGRKLAGERGRLRCARRSGHPRRGARSGRHGDGSIRPRGHRSSRGGYSGRRMLTGVILLLCIAQLGPILVLIPAVGWLFWNDQSVGNRPC